VVLDALFTKDEPRQHYRALAERIGTPFQIVYVTAPEQVIKERLEARAVSGDDSEATFALYLDRKPHFVVPTDAIRIENNGDLAETARQVYAKVFNIENRAEIA
jgi:predicted kinase